MCVCVCVYVCMCVCVYVTYRRTGFNCVVKLLHLWVLKVNCVFNTYVRLAFPRHRRGKPRVQNGVPAVTWNDDIIFPVTNVLCSKFCEF